MFNMRAKQMNVIKCAHQQETAKAICEHLCTYFPEKTNRLNEDELLERVTQCMRQAMQFGLTSLKDLYKFLNICATYGWQFYADDNLKWMRDWLEDDFIVNASWRLDLLVDQCVDQQKIKMHNESINNNFYPEKNLVKKDKRHQENTTDNHECKQSQELLFNKTNKINKSFFLAKQDGVFHDRTERFSLNKEG